VEFKPFRALRPRDELAAKIASPPYDVVSREEARALANGDPYTFLHVVRPEVDLDPAVDLHDAAVYERGRANFRGMIERGWMVRDERRAYYVYRQRAGDHRQTGILGVSAVDDYLGGRIKRHEHTRPDKEDDRVRLNEAIAAHPGPVMVAYRPVPELDALVASVTSSAPRVRFIARDGVEHALWVVDDAAVVGRVVALFREVPATYIADGHHRAAAAARVGQRLRERAAAARSTLAHDYFLSVLFPSNQLRVLDYNRVVADLAGLTPGAFLERVRRAGFDVHADHAAGRPPGPGRFGAFLGGRWYLLTAHDAIREANDPIERLDVALLARAVLRPILGIGDERTDPRIDFIGGIRGMEALEARVRSGAAAVAFALWPTSLDDVMRVADAGRVMPPKSTWFEPKLRSGLAVQLLDGEPL
jgi:uncharacterized protein (DUF1015 family)